MRFSREETVLGSYPWGLNLGFTAGVCPKVLLEHWYGIQLDGSNEDRSSLVRVEIKSWVVLLKPASDFSGVSSSPILLLKNKPSSRSESKAVHEVF